MNSPLLEKPKRSRGKLKPSTDEGGCDSPAHPELPIEVMTDVLVRLPIKSILACKCVCRSWRSLISNPHFINTHLDFSSSLHRTRLVFMQRNPMYCSLNSILNEPSVPLAKLECPALRDNIWVPQIIGSCNGLLCLLERTEAWCQARIVIWNPSTGVPRQLPPGWFCRKFKDFVYGFGYDPSSDDYKVVAVYRHRHNILCDPTRTQVPATDGVFLLKSNSWRSVPVVFAFTPVGFGSFVGGTLNWAVKLTDGSINSWGVASFDVATEKFRMLPSILFINREVEPVMSTLEGRLCILTCNYSQQLSWDVWVMKENDMKSSWDLVATVKCPPDLKFFSEPLLFFKDTLLVYQLRQEGFHYRVSLFDPQERSSKDPLVLPAVVCTDACICPESLVSPYANRRIPRANTYNLRSRKRSKEEMDSYRGP